MKLLLDTHVLLWSIGKTSELSEKVIQEIKDPNNEVLVSAVSLWEIALKYSIGKLIMDLEITAIPKYCEKMGFELVPLEPIEAINSLHLPSKSNHKDPFDRMLIYQCIMNGYTLISRDRKIESYRADGLNYVW